MSKAQLRQEALARRQSVPPNVAAAFRARLAAAGWEWVAARPQPVVSLYWPSGSEADPLGLLTLLADRGVATALPITVSRGAPLDFRLWRPGDPKVIGQMRIPEPAPHLARCQPDVLFVPLAAFDRRGHRIGYGAGHYDRTLAALRAEKPVLAIGVAYATQEVDAAPAEPHDQPLDIIITELETIDCRAGPG